MTEYHPVYDRNIGVWSEALQEKLWNTTVGIAGLGGAGGALASLLARNGFGRLKLADFDRFERHNIQRQIFAFESTLGMPKAEVTARAIADINSAIQLEVFAEGVNDANLDAFLDGCDFVHEVVDYTVPGAKLAIHRRARERGIIVSTAAMTGAGVTTFLFHPDHLSFEEYFRPEAPGKSWDDIIREVFGTYPDYMDMDLFKARVGRGTIPTTADGALLAAVTTAGLYKRILMGKPVAFAPKVVKIDMLDDAAYARNVVDGAPHSPERS